MFFILEVMLWRTNKILFIASDLVIRTFLTFYIWQTKNDLETILVFSLAYFVGIPISSLLSGFVTDKLDPKFSILLGTWLQVIYLFLIIIFGSQLTTETLVIIAIIGGMGEGFRRGAMRVIDHNKGIHQNEARHHATRTVIQETLQLIIPLAGAYLISTTNDYSLLFKITIAILILNTITIAFLDTKHKPNKFELIGIMTFPGTNRDKSVLAKGAFIEGLSESITITILPIIILIFVGNIFNWGVINTALVTIALLVSYIISRYINDRNSKYVYAGGALIFAMASVFFITEFNFLIVIVFLIAKTVMDVIKESSYYSSLNRMIREDQQQNSLYSEYQFLIEFFTTIGRIIPIILLLIIGLNINDQLVIRLAFFCIGILPLITISVLGNSKIFEEEYHKPEHIETENITV